MTNTNAPADSFPPVVLAAEPHTSGVTSVETGVTATSGPVAWESYDLDRRKVVWNPQGAFYRIDSVQVWANGDVTLHMVRQTKRGTDYQRGACWLNESLAVVQRWNGVSGREYHTLQAIEAQAAVKHSGMVAREIDENRRGVNEQAPTHMDERHTELPKRTPIIGRVVAADPASRALAAGIPTVDEVADAIADGTWAAAPQASAIDEQSVPNIPVIHLQSGAVFARPADEQAPEVVSVEALEAEADAQDAPDDYDEELHDPSWRADVPVLDDVERDLVTNVLDLLEREHVAHQRDRVAVVRDRIAELEAQSARLIAASGDALKLAAERGERIAELERRDAAAQEMLSRAVAIERERDDYAATLVRVTDRNAELIAERDRIRKVADDKRACADSLADQLGEVRVQLAAALGMNVDHPIPTDGQLVRDVADLRAENARLERRLDDEF
jgi:hypothetical protein